jgi:hypothetical protein
MFKYIYIDVDNNSLIEGFLVQLIIRMVHNDVIRLRESLGLTQIMWVGLGHVA